MPRLGATPFAFPEFRGATRRLLLWNLCAYFALLVFSLLAAERAGEWGLALGFTPYAFLHGWIWQPLTYSLVHFGLWGTLLELLSLWFLAGFLEMQQTAKWVTGLYATSVLGAAAAATAICVVAAGLGHPLALLPLTGCFGGIFGLLTAIGALYGDTQFMLFPLPMSIKARHLAVLYGLIAVATMLMNRQPVYAFAQLGGALAGLLYIRLAPRRGIGFGLSEGWYGLRNRYYRWKRRRAARKFEVYMRSQGRTVRFDGQGRQLDEDPSDKKRWN